MKRGDLHTFHGAFAKRKDAEAKASRTPGAIVRVVEIRGDRRYLVMRPGRGVVGARRRQAEARRLKTERSRARRRRSRLEEAPF